MTPLASPLSPPVSSDSTTSSVTATRLSGSPQHDPVRPASGLRRATATAVQVVALVAIWFASDALVHWLHLPVPAGVVGLFLLLALLMSGRFAPRWIKSGADWMLSEMLLFFVPSAVAIVQYGHLIESEGIRLMLVVIPGTMLVMCVTAVAVEFGVKLERGIALRRLRRQRHQRPIRRVHATPVAPTARQNDALAADRDIRQLDAEAQHHAHDAVADVDASIGIGIDISEGVVSDAVIDAGVTTGKEAA